MATKKRPAKAPTPQLSRGTKTGLAIAIIALASFAIWKGGQISLTPGKVVISGTSNKVDGPADAQPKVQQKAIASNDDSNARNSLGNINRGVPASPRATNYAAPANITQEAQANGKNAEAMNAAGDITLK